MRGDTKRITIAVDASLDVAKKQLESELGIEMSYVQFVNYLVKHYRKTLPVVSQWRKT